MKIKSLLIGSAAAVVAAPAAFAADIIIPEPEMVEYVRVCDAAGAGYWYIPGSETCLKISGEVKYYLDFDLDDNDFVGIDYDPAPGVGTPFFAFPGDIVGDPDLLAAVFDSAVGLIPPFVDDEDLIAEILPDDPIAQWLNSAQDADAQAVLADALGIADATVAAALGNIQFTDPNLLQQSGVAEIDSAITAYFDAVNAVASDLFGYGDADDGFNHGYEAVVTFEAWNDTDLGALYSNITLKGEGSSDDGAPFGDNNVFIDKAYFTLGGLHVGYNSSMWDFGVAGNADDFSGGDTANRLSYAFDAGNFTIEGGVEHDSDGDFTPNFLVKGSAEVDMFSATLAYAYDASGNTSHVKGVVGAYGFELGAHWNSGLDTSGALPVAGEYHGRGEWGVAAGYAFEATPSLTITPSVAWHNNVVWALGYSGLNELAVGAELDWVVVEGLTFEADIKYRNIQNVSGADDLDLGVSLKRTF